MQAVYDAHPPQPLELTLKSFKSLADFPDLEDIKNHTYISTEDAQASRSSHVQVTKKLLPYPDGLFSGQGIVMLAGGRYTGFATTGLGMLREVGSKLPVEIWVKDHQEENEEWCKELSNEGIACRRLSDYMDTKLLEHGYQLKISSIFFSSFEQILFLDADNVPVRNPDGIFKSAAFTNTGVILWPDYWTHTGAPVLPYVVGLSDAPSELLRGDQTAESGQLMWDKKRHWKVRVTRPRCLFEVHANLYSDRRSAWLHTTTTTALNTTIPSYRKDGPAGATRTHSPLPFGLFGRISTWFRTSS